MEQPPQEAVVEDLRSEKAVHPAPMNWSQLDSEGAVLGPAELRTRSIVLQLAKAGVVKDVVVTALAYLRLALRSTESAQVELEPAKPEPVELEWAKPDWRPAMVQKARNSFRKVGWA